MKDSNITQNSCKRCGTCCQKGGPTLHTQDIDAINNIPLKPKNLLTLRKGELIWHPLKQQLITLEHEIIKIKGKNDSWCCMFYEETSRKCTCYKYRPIECKVLKCWDTREIEELFLKDTINRAILLRNTPNILELVNNYEKKFDLRYFFYLIQQKQLQDIQRLIELDSSFREQLVATTSIKYTELDFYFGRPLEIILKQIQSILQISIKKASFRRPFNPLLSELGIIEGAYSSPSSNASSTPFP